jgi:hypothetical protein
VITVRTFASITVNGLRLGNTFQPGHGTTGFRYHTLSIHCSMSTHHRFTVSPLFLTTLCNA